MHKCFGAFCSGQQLCNSGYTSRNDFKNTLEKDDIYKVLKYFNSWAITRNFGRIRLRVRSVKFTHNLELLFRGNPY